MSELKLLLQLDRLQQINRLAHYTAYPYQEKFHHAEGYLTPGRLAYQRFLMAANQVGKTFCAGMETAMHATGRYPDWWKGHRIISPPVILCGSNTNETARDIIQKELIGDPEDESKFGTGTIPLECIGKVARKAGVPNALDSILVKHKSGRHSKIVFRAYEQGFKKFMGHRYDIAWLDEEPPADIWSQIIRATIARRNALIYATFTPEEGMTELVTQIMNDLRPGQALINATWDDAMHMTSELKESRLAAFSPHEREMRSKGVPIMGSGLVFPFVDNALVVDPFEIPKHWPQITGIDFGWDHPTAAVKLAWDRDSDTVYLVAEYRESKQIPAVHAAAINAWGEWIPVAWPHDGLNAEKGTGESLAKKYREAHVNMLPWKATLPATDGKTEGQGSNSVEESILEMYERMETGRWKVFSTCKQWLEEKRMYHRKDGKLVKLNDDLISASRYALMMLRHARIQMRPRPQPPRRGASNW